jgi:hypothetical protein
MSEGAQGAFNHYVRPATTVLTFDLIGGHHAGQVNAGSGFGAMVAAAAPGPGLDFDNSNYAALVPMQVGLAREARPKNWKSNEYTAYWLPWADTSANEHRLDNLNVKFFFTAMFSGCTFCVAQTVGGAGLTDVWVTHIAWDPGPNLPPQWAAVVGAAPIAGNAQARRLRHEEAFFRTRLGAGRPVRSVTEADDHLVSMQLGLGGLGLRSIAIANHGAVPVGSQRLIYGDHGEAFIVGWRDNTNAWRFAVQHHPVGFNALGAGVIVPAPVAPLAVQQFV